MDLEDKLIDLANRINKQKSNVLTEEAAKTAFVLPFIQALGYDIFNPSEVIPEFTADHGVKKGEKVDYAIKYGDEIAILIECKTIGASLEAKHAGQLFRYFSVTDAKFSILTDGIKYLFYSDLDKENKMDDRHFFEFDVCKHDKEKIEQLKKFTKNSFDVSMILDTASDLKYRNALMSIISKEFKSPSDDFIKILTNKVYDGRMTAPIKDKFSSLITSSLTDFLRNEVNERLELALNKGSFEVSHEQNNLENKELVNGIETTKDEIESHMIIKAIASELVDSTRINIRDAQTYCAILFDDNNRNPIARLYYKKTKLSIGIFMTGVETKIDLDKISDLYLHKKILLESISQYQ